MSTISWDQLVAKRRAGSKWQPPTTKREQVQAFGHGDEGQGSRLADELDLTQGFCFAGHDYDSDCQCPACRQIRPTVQRERELAELIEQAQMELEVLQRKLNHCGIYSQPVKASAVRTWPIKASRAN